VVGRLDEWGDLGASNCCVLHKVQNEINEVFAAMYLKMTFFWDKMPCHRDNGFLRSETKWWPYVHGSKCP
jgi:hypothetical protein